MKDLLELLKKMQFPIQDKIVWFDHEAYHINAMQGCTCEYIHIIVDANSIIL